jgi:EmrB/QacA subfamily drug resistance transporter
MATMRSLEADVAWKAEQDTAVTLQSGTAQPATGQAGPAAGAGAGAGAGGRPSAQRWALALSSAASFLVVLDSLVVATALTSIGRDLGSSLGGLEWTVNAYALSFAVLLLTGAALGDMLGRRRVFAAGLVLFAVASAACALAPSVGVLIAARAVQGAGAAAIMPMALALLNMAFPPHRRGRAIGMYGSITSVAVVLGPVLGGAVTQGLGWQWVFWVNVPVALAAVPLVLTRLAEPPRPGATIDVPGVLLAVVAALGLAWGLIRGNEAGWGSAQTIGAFVTGAVAAVAFGAWERRAAAPMLPPRLLRSRALAAGNVAIFALNGSLTVVVFLMPQFQQVVSGQDPLGAGLRLLPWGIAPFLLASPAGALADRIGARSLSVAGLAVQAAAVAWLAAVVTPSVGYGALVAPIATSGVGLAIAIPSLTRSATSTTPLADVGKASGAFATMRQLGGAFGVAIGGAAFAAAGAITSPQAFSDGFRAALIVAAALAFAGLIAAAALPGRSG